MANASGEVIGKTDWVAYVVKDLLFARFKENPPASLEGVDKLQRELSFSLPVRYVEFMRTRNGGEGFIGESYLVLWRVEELISMNNVYNVPEFAPDLFLFGSDGGGEAFGFDTRSVSRAIVPIPFITMEMEDANVLAADFDEFLAAL